jgi:two-component system sensor histidine kinase MprB
MELNWLGRAEHFRSGPPQSAPPATEWPTAPPPRDRQGVEDGPSGYFPEAEAAPLDGAGDGQRPGRRRALARSPIAWLRQVSFRGRISVLVAAAVALAVALAALSSYIAVSNQMERQADANLQSAVQEVPPLVHTMPAGMNVSTLDPGPFIRLQALTGYQVQVIANTPTQGVQAFAVVPNSASGWTEERFFKLSKAARATFDSPQGTESPLESAQGKDGNPYRLATISIIQGSLAVMLGYPLASIDNTLSFLRLMLILVAIGGVALAATLGWAVGRASMHPVEELTLAAERVAETQDLSQKIEDTSNDELGRLARSFNAMLAALGASKQQQAQLVSDAGHELRTPLTSLRTNIEVLLRNKDLPPEDRDELLSDVNAQLQELATLVGDLVDLARDEERQEAEPQLVAFDTLVGHALERAKRRAMSVRFEPALEAGYVRAQPALLERAVVNVLDNAAKWSPPGGLVRVRLSATETNWHLVVEDQGPGISPEDLPHIFDRFYRAASARAMPGSGLGLAIVKRVVTNHGGTIDVTCPPDGGTRVEVVLPLSEVASPALLGEGSLDGAASNGSAPAEDAFLSS